MVIELNSHVSKQAYFNRPVKDGTRHRCSVRSQTSYSLGLMEWRRWKCSILGVKIYWLFRQPEASKSLIPSSLSR